MWNVMKNEMRMPILAAAACAAVMLVASPVSAEPATDEEARAAQTVYRTGVREECSTWTGKAKAGCIGKIRETRSAAREEYNSCIDLGTETREYCKSMANGIWVDAAKRFQN